MKKLLIALAALALPTGAMAQHYNHHDYGHHYGERYHRHNGIRFGIFVNPRMYYGVTTGYYGPTWPTYSGFVGCTEYGRNGLLVTNYGNYVRSDEYYSRRDVRCRLQY